MPRQIQPICLPSYSNTNYNNINAFVSGWGTTQILKYTDGKAYYTEASDVLKNLKLVVDSEEKCRLVIQDFDPRTMICAHSDVMFNKTIANDACSGDSGGKLYL